MFKIQKIVKILELDKNAKLKPLIIENNIEKILKIIKGILVEIKKNEKIS